MWLAEMHAKLKTAVTAERTGRRILTTFANKHRVCVCVEEALYRGEEGEEDDEKRRGRSKSL